MIFFTSDVHDFHKNICKGVSTWSDKSGCRDFSSLDKMNEALVTSINSNVSSSDTLYHLGDWSFGSKHNVAKFRHQINCEDIRLIRGNHDKYIDEYASLFTWIKSYHEFSYNKIMFCLFHYSMRVWNNSHHGSIHLYGHSHGTLPGIGRSLDVGWDVFKRPISIDEVISLMSGIEPHSVDHHNKETT